MDKHWVIKGTFLGLVFFLAMLLQRPIGISTQFSVTSGIIENSLVSEKDLVFKNPETKTGYDSRNEYYSSSGGAIAKSISEPMNYEMIFAGAVILGAFLGSMFFPSEKKDILVNSRKEGNSFKLYMQLFLGGFVTLYGARLANGCTSGHMMSGMSQMTLSSFIFSTVVFIFAIFVAKKWGD